MRGAIVGFGVGELEEGLTGWSRESSENDRLSAMVSLVVDIAPTIGAAIFYRGGKPPVRTPKLEGEFSFTAIGVARGALSLDRGDRIINDGRCLQERCGETQPASLTRSN